MVSKEVEKLLLKVQKPGRYVGGELNEVIKDKKKVDCRFAFCFPDTYEVGMPHLGMTLRLLNFSESAEPRVNQNRSFLNSHLKLRVYMFLHSMM